MATFVVRGTAKRTVTLPYSFEVVVEAWDFAQATTRATAEVAKGDTGDADLFEEADGTETESTPFCICVDGIDKETEPEVAPAPAYTRIAAPAPQAGFAPADVHTRAGGYSPVRVAHRPAR